MHSGPAARGSLAVLLLAGSAGATPRFDLGLEGGGTVPLGPVASSFTAGGGVAVRAQLQLVGPLRAQVGGGFLSLAGSEPGAARGNALWVGGGARAVVFAGAGESLWGGLWVDAQADVVGTGPNVRFGYELGLGAQLTPRWPFGFGPWIRFMHVVDRPGPDSADALLLSFGVAVTLGGFPRAEAVEPAVVVAPPAVDADGDGVSGERDRCPERPETVNGFEDEDGCPDVVPVETTTRIEIMKSGTSDRDGDGFIDEHDQCPDAAEVFNGVKDDDGCADAGEALVVLGAERLELKQPMKFEKVKGGWRTAKGSLAMLSAAAIVLSLHPEIRAVRIEVGVEKQATLAATVELSLRRAEAVRKTLVELGLDGARLAAVGEPSGARDRVALVLVR